MVGIYLKMGWEEFHEGAWQVRKERERGKGGREGTEYLTTYSIQKLKLQGKGRALKAPNLTKLTKLFNYISFLLAIEILYTESSQERMRVVVKVVTLAHKLKKVSEGREGEGAFKKEMKRF